MLMQNDIVAARSQGPHFKEPKVEPAKRRAHVAQVIEIATATMPKATMRKLGALSFAVAADDDDAFYFGQIRSEPMGKSGLEFRFPVPARDTGKKDPEHVAGELVRAAVTVARAAPKLAEHTDMVRELAERTIERATGGIAGMRVVAIGLIPELPGAMMRSTIDVEMLGCDLRPCVDRVVHNDSDGLEEKLTKLVDQHLTRRQALAEARVAEATGWIDGASLLILREAGLDLAEMVQRLAVEPEIEFYFGGEEGYDLTGAVYWVDGTIKGFVEDRTRGATFRLQTDQLTIEMPNIPATVIASLIGRRLRAVVDLRFIPETAIIVDVQESGEWLYLDLEIGRSTIEEALRTTTIRIDS